MLAACLRAAGTSVFVENVFQNRFRFTEELCRLGARIHTEGRVAVVTGVKALHGAPTVATDLRGGAALMIAALSAMISQQQADREAASGQKKEDNDE